LVAGGVFLILEGSWVPEVPGLPPRATLVHEAVDNTNAANEVVRIEVRRGALFMVITPRVVVETSAVNGLFPPRRIQDESDCSVDETNPTINLVISTPCPPSVARCRGLD
jgi:hypothetical protein